MSKRQEKWKEFKELTEEGKTINETSEALGVSNNTTSLWRAELKKQEVGLTTPTLQRFDTLQDPELDKYAVTEIEGDKVYLKIKAPIGSPQSEKSKDVISLKEFQAGKTVYKKLNYAPVTVSHIEPKPEIKTEEEKRAERIANARKRSEAAKQNENFPIDKPAGNEDQIDNNESKETKLDDLDRIEKLINKGLLTINEGRAELEYQSIDDRSLMPVRKYLHDINQLINIMTPICAVDDDVLQDTAKLAYKILIYGLNDEFVGTKEAKDESEKVHSMPDMRK